jgi:hypothetical protein
MYDLVTRVTSQSVPFGLLTFISPIVNDGLPSIQNFQPSSLGLAFSLVFPENCRDCKYESCPLDGIQMEIDHEGYTFSRFGTTNVEWRNMVNFWGKFRLHRVQVIDKLFCEACAIKIHVRRWNYNMNEHNVKGQRFPHWYRKVLNKCK